MEIFVPDYEWNAHYSTVEESVKAGFECGDFDEGDEFKMVRLTVGACTTYRIVDGKPVPVAVAFPDKLPANAELRGAKPIGEESRSNDVLDGGN